MEVFIYENISTQLYIHSTSTSMTHITSGC